MMMVLTATPVLHDARTRCLTPCDGQKPAESRGHFRPHGMQTRDKPVRKMGHGVGDAPGRSRAVDLGGDGERRRRGGRRTLVAMASVNLHVSICQYMKLDIIYVRIWSKYTAIYVQYVYCMYTRICTYCMYMYVYVCIFQTQLQIY